MLPLMLFLTSCHQEEKIKNKSTIPIKIEKRTGDCAENAFLNWENFCSPFSPVLTKTKVLTNIPGYPASCSFTVQYDIKECVIPVVNEIHILIGNFNIIAVNCPQYHNDLDNIINNPGIGIPTMAEYFNNLFDQLSRVLENDLFNEYLLNYNLDCSKPTGYYTFTTNYYEASCYTYCVVESTRPGEFEPVLRLICGEECCQTEVSICYDYVNKRIIKEVNKTPLYEGEPGCSQWTNIASLCDKYTECVENCE